MESEKKWQRLLDGTVKDSDALMMVLRKMAATVNVYDLMEVRVFLERSCRFVQERYRTVYIDSYMSMVVDSVLDLRARFPGVSETASEWYRLHDASKRLDEMNAPIIVGLTVLYRTFLKGEPLHPPGTPFPGGFEVERKDGVYYCPVKDKQKDNPKALCDICIARQTPI
ncbi:DUF2115 family protein [Methanothermobacter thermautotrophicus]|uniref:DUF2115 domain-containing protein n=1 Tax=Methanothermobacter thermautotrophicus TaxID=145262 RepID=UPI001D00226D|nr:DUF2115 family protein [Methanothermobacter thermautotrophicus]